MEAANKFESKPASAFWLGQSEMTFVDAVVARLPSEPVPSDTVRVAADPCSIGSADCGRIVLNGMVPYGSAKYSIPAGGIWEISAKNRQLQTWIHGFTWLDDLAAVRDGFAVAMSRDSVMGWIRRYGAGKGPGWTADIAARRLIRWVGHSQLLMTGWTERERDTFANAIFRNAKFVERRWQSLPVGSRRIEALAGMIYANSMFPSRDPLLRTMSETIAREANRIIGPHGEIPSRNPEELLQMATLLAWAKAVLVNAGLAPLADHVNAVKRAALVLRGVRHAKGTLARFQGGGPGPKGYLDRVLAESGERYVPLGQLSMGYSRLSARGASVVVDAAAPNCGKGSETSHASTLAFEFLSKGIPIIVNGSRAIDPMQKTEQELRETRSSSTVEVDGCSSSRFAPLGIMRGNRDRILLMVPENVRIEQMPGIDDQTLIASHDGYGPQFGLTHMRRMDLAKDGGRLWGEDTIWARSKEDREACSRVLSDRNQGAIRFAARFHIHPETKVADSGNSVRLRTEGGDQWNFHFEGAAELKVAPSEYMDEATGEMRMSSQIALESSIGEFSGQLRWRFERIRIPQSSTLTVGRADERIADRQRLQGAKSMDQAE